MPPHSQCTFEQCDLGPCARCGEVITNDFYKMTMEDRIVRLHEKCARDSLDLRQEPPPAPTKSPKWRGKCVQCGEDVIGGCLAVAGIGPLHDGCHEAWDKMGEARRKEAARHDCTFKCNPCELLPNGSCRHCGRQIGAPPTDATWRDKPPLL